MITCLQVEKEAGNVLFIINIIIVFYYFMMYIFFVGGLLLVVATVKMNLLTGAMLKGQQDPKDQKWLLKVTRRKHQMS
jgi:predicted membrane protein